MNEEKQEWPIPFIGDAVNMKEGDFFAVDDKEYGVKNITIQDDRNILAEVIVNLPDGVDIPEEYDHIIVGVQLSAPVGAVLRASVSASWVSAMRVPEITRFKCDNIVGKVTVDEYLVCPRKLFLSLTGSFSQLTISNAMVETLSQSVEPAMKLISVVQGFEPLMENKDRSWLKDTSQFIFQMKNIISAATLEILKDVDGSNFITKTISLLKFNDAALSQINNPLNSLNEMVIKYDALSKVIVKFENQGAQYIGNDVQFKRFLETYDVTCCLLTYLSHIDKKTCCDFFTYKSKGAVPDAVYGVVNLELVSLKAGYGKQPNKDVIRTFRNKKVDCLDLTREIHETKDSYAIGPEERPKLPPRQKAALEMPCPGHYLATCPQTKRKWLCQKCHGKLFYGFDEHIHCRCGGAHASTFLFQCVFDEHSSPSPTHARFMQQLEDLTPMKIHNVLILGQSGVGKSTWINATTNYMSFKSLDEAEKSLEVNEPLVVIPVRFNITDDQMNSREIRVGDDENEVLQVGASATQICKTYSIELGDNCVNFIDTPGLGDNRGVDEDRKNVKKVLDYVRHIDLIHGICILLKPNETRISVLLKYCLKEILSNLHQSCSKNLIFCFTNSRATSYKPGETMPILMELLKDINVNIPVVEKTFCLDNESFRYLCCKTTPGISFSDKEQESFKKSWQHSVRETERLLSAVSFLEPHRTEETMSLNRARRMILSLTRPIADITQNIERNIQAINDQKTLVEASETGVRDLQKLMQVPQIDLIAQPLGYPRTVCTSDKCARYHTLPQTGQREAEYVQHCHAHCYLTGVTPEQYPNKDLLGCWAMSGENCHQCSCSYKTHMHILYEQRLKESMVLDDDVRRRIDDQQSDADKKRIMLTEYEDKRNKLEHEKDIILRACVKFAHFLRSNAIAAYNDAFGDYLDTLIEREESKKDQTRSEIAMKNKLKETKKCYEEEVRIFRLASNERPLTVSPETIRSLERELYELPIHGRQLQDIMKVAIAAEDEAARYTTKAVSNQPHGKKGFLQTTYNTISGLWAPKQNYVLPNSKNTNSGPWAPNQNYVLPNNPNTNSGKKSGKNKRKNK